jgi:hypothetical protein
MYSKTYHLPLAEWLGYSSFQKEETFHTLFCSKKSPPSGRRGGTK